MAYDGMDPDEYRGELLDAGASAQDADVAAADLRRRQGGT
jgi:hypothetical protein